MDKLLPDFKIFDKDKCWDKHSSLFMFDVNDDY